MKLNFKGLAENCIFLSFLEVEFCYCPLFDWTDIFQVNLVIIINEYKEAFTLSRTKPVSGHMSKMGYT